MYRDFYGLQVDPFGLDPNLDFLFISRAHEEAVSHIAYGLEQQEAIILITGDIGTGKTVALHRIVAQLSGTFVPIMINVTTIDFLQFMRLVMFKMGEDEPAPDISGLLHTFELRLKAVRSRGQKILLIVDEAQNCSASLLECIRLLLNLAQPGDQVLQLVLAGQIGLEVNLAHADLRQFRQRIRVSYRLECLNRAETEAYVGHRLKVAGRETRLFERDALDRIYQLSGGVPRLVNQYADRALLAGFVGNAKHITAAHVEDGGLNDGSSESDAAGDWMVGAAEPIPARAPQTPPEPPIRPAPARAEPTFARKRGSGARGRAWLVAALLGVAVIAAIFAVVRLRGHGGGAGLHGEAGNELAKSPVRDSSVSGIAAEAPNTADVVVQEDQSTESIAATGSAATGTGEMADATLPMATIAEPRLGDKVATTEPAQVTTVDTKAAVSAEPGAFNSVGERDGPVSVHVFSFRTPDRAENSCARLHRAGIAAFVLEEKGANGVDWYRVYIGPLASRAKAEALVDSLRSVGAIEYASITGKAPPRP